MNNNYNALKLTAEQGDADAQFKLGVVKGIDVPQNNHEAFKWFELAAKQGHSGAQHNLGVMYAKGMGVPHNIIEAIKWFESAAKQGHSGAQYELGEMYTRVPQHNHKALKWFESAAKQGHPCAQHKLGVKYATGDGVTQCYIEAYFWLLLAVENGNKDAGLLDKVRDKVREMLLR